MKHSHFFSRLLILLVTVNLFACSSTTHKSNSSAHSKSKTSKSEHKYEYAKTESAPKIDSVAISLVTDGIQKLKSQSLNEAEWTFEEAINLDPDYGPAYYWLARVRYKLNDAKQALNLLEKAKALVQGSTLWLERIDDFRQHISSQGN